MSWGRKAHVFVLQVPMLLRLGGLVTLQLVPHVSLMVEGRMVPVLPTWQVRLPLYVPFRALTRMLCPSARLTTCLVVT